MANNRNYPECRGCNHPLCFMDRRDYDECPACGLDIPTWLKVDNDFRPTDSAVPAGMIPMKSGLVSIRDEWGHPLI